MNDEMFVLIEASKLSLDDEFMRHRPKNLNERVFKDMLEKVIKKGIADFWRPRMDPTFDEAGNICFKVGEKPAVGKSYNWWRENAKKFNLGRKSRLGTKEQYIAFLGVLIKELIAENWSVDNAWDAVCKNSWKLGHFYDSPFSKKDFEPTGSRAVAGFYDLANTCKILAEDEDVGGLWLGSGAYNCDSYFHPIYSLGHYNYQYHYDNDLDISVGWIVMD